MRYALYGRPGMSSTAWTVAPLTCQPCQAAELRRHQGIPIFQGNNCQLKLESALPLQNERRTLRANHQRSRHVLVRSAAGRLSAPEAQEGNINGGKFASIVVPTALALMLCNMDRICMSVAILPMSAELNWAPSVQGIVQSAFLWGYTLTQYLGGSLADQYGGKKVMAYGIVWFSVASLLVPFAFSSTVAAAGLTLPAMIAARVMVGLGEGVALPCMNQLVGSNIPQARRSTALGACFSGFHSGNLVGLVLSPLILSAFGWRTLFLAFGIFGGPLLLLWQLMVPNKRSPQQQHSQGQFEAQPAASEALASGPGTTTMLRTSLSALEVQAVASTQPTGGNAATSDGAQNQPSRSDSRSQTDAEPAPLRQARVGVRDLLGARAVWAIVIANIVNHWGYFIFLFHIPSYFVQTLGLNLRTSAFLSLLPWAVMAVGSTSAGLLADSYIRRGVPVTLVRKRLQTVAFLGPAVALAALSQPGISKNLAVALMTAALGITSLGQAGFVANISDVAPKHAGKLFGLCNTFGSSAGILGVTGVGFILEKTGSYALVFQMTTALYLFGALFWNLFCETDVKFA